MQQLYQVISPCAHACTNPVPALVNLASSRPTQLVRRSGLCPACTLHVHRAPWSRAPSVHRSRVGCSAAPRTGLAQLPRRTPRPRLGRAPWNQSMPMHPPPLHVASQVRQSTRVRHARFRALLPLHTRTPEHRVQSRARPCMPHPCTCSAWNLPASPNNLDLCCQPCPVRTALPPACTPARRSAPASTSLRPARQARPCGMPTRTALQPVQLSAIQRVSVHCPCGPPTCVALRAPSSPACCCGSVMACPLARPMPHQPRMPLAMRLRTTCAWSIW